MSDETTLSDLLLRWEEFQEEGRDVPPEELGRDHPELLCELRRRISALRALRWVKDADSPSTTGGRVTQPVTGEDVEERLPEVLAGRYRLVKQIAEGGFGHVWQGLDLVTGRRVAVKIAKQHRVSSPDQLHAFHDEASKAAALRHPGIVPVHDVGHEGDVWFHVSDLIEGTDLGRWMKHHRPTPAEAARMVAGVARALDHAHQQGIIHRDVKPANILVDGQGRLFLTDFGIAVTAEQLRQRAVDCAGTLAYMAPEQALCDTTRIDARSDVYGLGVILYELLVGRPPFQASTPAVLRERVLTGTPPGLRQIEPNVAEELEAICLRCLAREPADRYQTAGQLADTLEAFAGRTEPK
jgi:serine/threonine protein kinase